MIGGWAHEMRELWGIRRPGARSMSLMPEKFTW